MNLILSAELVFDPLLPEPLILLLGLMLGVGTLWIYLRVGRTVGPWRNAVLLLLRLCGIASVLALLLQPSINEQVTPPKQERVTFVAIDSSLSMKQRDLDGVSRIDAAKNLLREAGVVTVAGMVDDPRLRLFEFHQDATLLEKPVSDLVPHGRTTRFHQSVSTLLNTLRPDEAINAVILLTDGHDFEMVNPATTGAAARMRQAPIFAVPFGRQGNVRDVAVRIASYQPYCYVKQKARISVALRVVGCEFEDIAIQLLRHGKPVQTKTVNAGELLEVPVEFEVTEPETGQFEYEVRSRPLEHETDTANNSVITFLNVIDQQIRVLLLEGDPYWDTTFLQRSLMRNDKFDVDAVLQYGTAKQRVIRKNPNAGAFQLPSSIEKLAVYDVIVLGRSIERLFTKPPGAGATSGELDASQVVELLNAYVQERAGTIVFSRGPAFESKDGDQLAPVLWGDRVKDRVRIQPTSEGKALAAFRTLNDSGSSLEELPELLAGKAAVEVQPLTGVLAVSSDNEFGRIPAVVHRRLGRGQVVSLGVEGLWRWGLNTKNDGANSSFDRFWDQLMLWLMAGRDFIPNRQFSFRPNSANIQLGEKIHFRLTMRQPDPSVKTVPVALFFNESEVGRVSMAAPPTDSSRLSAEYLPEKPGRYRAVAQFPDGTSQETRFIVFNENLEETEVASDVLCLRRLCESSGGRVIDGTEFSRLIRELNRDETELTPQTRIRPVWNRAWVFYLIGVMFGLDWFLRRRWGLS